MTSVFFRSPLTRTVRPSGPTLSGRLLTPSSRMASRCKNPYFAVAFDKRHPRWRACHAVHPGGIYQTELGRPIDPSRIPWIVEQM